MRHVKPSLQVALVAALLVALATLIIGCELESESYYLQWRKPLTVSEWAKEVQFRYERGKNLWDGVPRSIMNEHFYQRCLTGYFRLPLNQLPDSVLSESLCQFAIDQDPKNLAFVPGRLTTEAMVLKTIASLKSAGSGSFSYCYENGELAQALVNIPESFWNKSTCLVAVRLNPCAVCLIPEELIDGEIAFAAVVGNPWLFDEIPPRALDNLTILYAVSKAPENLKYVPNEFWTPELVNEVLSANPAAIRYIPENLRGRDICLKVVRSNGELLAFVPWRERDVEMCLAALEDGNDAWDHVPKKLFFNPLFLSALR